MRHQPKETRSVDPQKIITGAVGLLLFATCTTLISTFGGLTCDGSHPYQAVPTTSLPETFVFFPWGSSVESLPVTIIGSVSLAYDTEYTMTFTEVMNRASGDLELHVQAQHPSTDGHATTHTGVLRSCHSGDQWIEWLNGDLHDTFVQCNKRAQTACEDATNDN